jgi:alkylhydroperoxidase/carboxymuconolactone decarboxylase family protein YurZ
VSNIDTNLGGALKMYRGCSANAGAPIARGEAPALTYYADRALENGVKPTEISETITHLAYYSGWEKAMAAISPVGEAVARPDQPA